MTEGKELIPVVPGVSPLAVMPVMDVAQAIERHKQMVRLVTSEMWHKGTDSGEIPGTDKPTLLLPGAQKLGFFFGLSPRYELQEQIEDWTGAQHGGEPLFSYTYKCILYHGDLLVAEAIGDCNSWEAKYRYRWVSRHEVPTGLDPETLKKRGGRVTEFDFAIDKAETGGKYGKPAEYWQQFRDAIANGTATKLKRETRGGKQLDAWEIDVTVYRIPNDDIFSQINTLKKMAQKRAYVGCIITATNGSEFFAQDMEDFIEEHLTIEGSAREVEEEKEPPRETVAKPRPAKAESEQATVVEGKMRPTPEPKAEAPKGECALTEAQKRQLDGFRRRIRGQISTLQDKYALTLLPYTVDGKTYQGEDAIYERWKREVARVEHLSDYKGSVPEALQLVLGWFEAEVGRQQAGGAA